MPPGDRLELLKKERAGQRSIRINEQWRICFRWADGDATDVEIPVPAFISPLSFSNNVYHTHMTSADLIRELSLAGWQLDRVRGSHHVFKHAKMIGIVVVPHPRKDLGTGLVKAIRRQAGIIER